MTNKRETAFKLLIMLFPILLTSVKSGGSYTYALILILILSDSKGLFQEQKKGDNLFWYGLLILFLVSGFSLFFSEDLKEGTERMDKFFRLMTCGLLYLYFIRKKYLLGKNLIYGIIISAIWLGIFSFYEIAYLEHPYAQGIYYSIGVSAYGVLYSFLLISYLIQFNISTPHQIIILFAVCSGLYAAYLSSGRGGWVAIPVLIAMMLLTKWKSFSKNKKILLVMSIVFAFGSLAFFQPKRIIDRVVLINHEVVDYLENNTVKSSIGNRLNVWKNSLIIFSENPIFGTGLGDFNNDDKSLGERGISQASSSGGHAHNIFLDALATTGILGFLSLAFALFIIPIYIAFQNKPDENNNEGMFYFLGLNVALISYFIFGSTEAWLARNIFVNGYAVIIPVLLSSLRIQYISNHQTIHSS